MSQSNNEWLRIGSYAVRQNLIDSFWIDDEKAVCISYLDCVFKFTHEDANTAEKVFEAIAKKIGVK